MEVKFYIFFVTQLNLLLYLVNQKKCLTKNILCEEVLQGIKYKLYHQCYQQQQLRNGAQNELKRQLI